MTSPRPQRLRVPASTSNLGPGFDAFGIALDIHFEIQWHPAPKTSLERHEALAESTLRLGQDPVMRGMRRASILADRPLPSGKLSVSSAVPPGRGVGLSGAGLVGGLLLGNRLCGNQLSANALMEEAIALEGNPENAVASMLGGAHWSLFEKPGPWLHHPIPLHRNLRFLLVIPPYPMPTKRSREALPSSVSFARAMRQAQRPPILLEGLRSLKKEFLHAGIADDLHVAPRLKLMTGAKAMLDFAYEAGALGATLSGAGSSLLILSKTGEVRNLEARLAKRVQRLWGKSGRVVTAKAHYHGAKFLRP